MATWWCKTCNRQISTDKPKPPKAQRFCPDHAGGNTEPAKERKKASPKAKALKKAS
jgi:hypothetical protein